MSEFRFTDGNLLVVYALTRPTIRQTESVLPDHLRERVKVTLETYQMVMHSKPDKNKTMLMVVASEPRSGDLVKEELVKQGIPAEIIATDSDSANAAQIVDRIYDMIKTKPNPPFVYFVGPYWLQDVYKSTVLSRLKDYKVQFYGALDHRPYEEVERERASDAPKKGTEYYKQKVKNRAVDMLLNVIFPD
jgi:hypothetical protein